jgi:hypothetical protein
MRRYYVFAILAILGFAAFAPAEVNHQVWTGQDAGGSLQGMIDFHADKLPGMPVAPDIDETLPDSYFDGNYHSGLGDNYTSNIWGWVKIPVSGTYTWHICSDDHGALYVAGSMQELAANYGGGLGTNPNLMCQVDGWTNFEDWNGADGGGNQTSAAQTYTAGQTLALYATMREGTGGDNLGVGWTLPGAGEITYLGENITNIAPVPTIAKNVAPAVGATDVLRDGATLQWGPGKFANTHNVYFSDNMDAVADGTALAAEGLPLATTHYDPGRLAFDTTYYWRVDEVNAAPDFTVYQGDIWSFTVEPEVLTVTDVSVSASSAMAGSEASKTIDGSGLTDGAHDTDLLAMWLVDTGDMDGRWIRYDLGKVYKLRSVHVWNHNTQTEAFLGYGIKEARIETSLDGETWTELKVAEIPQATGLSGYTGSDVALDDVVARYVKITVVSNYSILGLSQAGLSEVRFMYVPVQAREPQPGDGAETSVISTDITLSWRAGREAGEHEVVFSEDKQSVIDGSAVIGTTEDTSYDPGMLTLARDYYWKINEVNEAETPSVYEGDLWHFNTPKALVIDDMESYKPEEGLFIWETWIDGFGVDDNGSVVGNGDDPEYTEVYEGGQSMPLGYDNTAAKSEATRTFDPPLDLTAGDPDSLDLYFKGMPYVVIGSYSVDGISWTDLQWNPPAELGEDIYLGLAVTSHDAASVATATIDSVSTTGSVTGDWTQVDIGGTHPAGNFTLVNGTFTIKAQGADIWGTADEFRYVYKQLSGEGSLTARVDTLDGTNEWCKAGVMLRNELTQDSAHTFMAATGTNGIHLQGRMSKGAASTQDADNGGLDGTQEIMEEPVWVRISRLAANAAGTVYVTVTDTAGKSVKVPHPNPEATLLGWTLLSVPMADLAGINISQVETLSIGVEGPSGSGTLYVDYFHTPKAYKPYDLFARYPLDGDVQDVSGNGFDGILTGEPVFVDGVMGQALEFSAAGGDDYVTIGTMNPSRTSGALTVALWAKWNGLSDQWQGLIGKRNAWATDNMMWDIEANLNDGTLGFRQPAGGVYPGMTLPEGEWEHVAGTVEGSLMKFYIGGEVVGENAAFMFGTNTEASMQFGCGQINGGNSFNGALDEIYIYGRALSDAEIAALAGK